MDSVLLGILWSYEQKGDVAKAAARDSTDEDFSSGLGSWALAI